MKALINVIEGIFALAIAASFFYFIFCIVSLIFCPYVLGIVAIILFIILMFKYLEEREFWRD